MNNLASILKDQGDLRGARFWAEHALDTSRHVLGQRHQITTIAAWNLLPILVAMNERQIARELLVSDLAWLPAQDPEQLGAAQRQIAGMVRELIGGGADQD